MSDPSLNLILRRRSEIETALADMVKRMEELRKELPDLETAERVLRKLTPSVGVERYPSTEISGKPDNIPTMPEMISEAIRSQDFLELGMEPKDILKFIADKWWPDVRSELVGPIAWRMAKRGQLVKDGSRYRLPYEEIGPAQSKSGEAAEQGPQSASVKPDEEVAHDNIEDLL